MFAKDTPMTEVLAQRPILSLIDLGDQMKKATKTKAIRAMAMHVLFSNTRVLEKFLLNTLEGTQIPRANSMLCVGDAGEVWQQAKTKLFAKYTITDVDENGWLICTPKPDNEVLAVEVTPDLCGPAGFTLIGQWGEERTLRDKQVFLQYGEPGDFVCQSLTDLNDRWIVRRGLFLSTYEWKSLGGVAE